jgi:hypothetical protein
VRDVAKAADPLLAAFLSPHFDRIFNNVATPAWAAQAAEYDEPRLHELARRVIRTVAEQCAADNPDPSMRCGVVLGDAGLGKTHAVLAELIALSRQGTVSPVVVQLSANIEADQVSQWLLRKVFDELSAQHFRDVQGQTPLERISRALWARLDPRMADVMQRFVEARNETRFHAHVALAANKICREARPALKAADEAVVAGLFLEAAGEGYSFTAWLRGSTTRASFGGREYDPLATEDARREVLVSLARVCRLVGSPLIIVADQIEAAMQIGSTQLLARLVAFLVQLTEENGCAVGIVICALGDTFEKELLQALAGGFQSRLRDGVRPVTLTTPEPEVLLSLAARRADALLKAHDLRAEPRSIDQIVPKQLLAGAVRPRALLDRIRQYREECHLAGRFVVPGGTAGEPPPPIPPPIDFDKLWEDWGDAAFGALRVFSDFERVELVAWLLHAAAAELPLAGPPRIERLDIEGPHPVRVIDVGYVDVDGHVAERWKIGYCGAPVSRGRLADQILTLLKGCTDAKPAIIAPGPVTGIDDSGKPSRPRQKLETLVTGPALLRLLDGGGRLVPVMPRHWEQISLAQGFIAAHEDRPGFTAWRRQSGFLARRVDIGALGAILVPEGASPERSRTATPQPPTSPSQTPAIIATPTAASSPAGAGAPAPESAHMNPLPRATPLRPVAPGTPRDPRDPRDTARLLIGTRVRLAGEAESASAAPVYWSLHRDDTPALPNFGLLVSGDAGQGKTQVIKGLISDVARLRCPTLIFDFKNDYGGDFARDQGFSIINLRDGLPFNPLKPAPQGPSGAQITPHLFEVVSIFRDVLRLGAQQEALLRNALSDCFVAQGHELNEWLPVDAIRSPSLADAIAAAHAANPTQATTLINRLGLLAGMPLLPGDADARMSFGSLLEQRVILSFNDLPNDSGLKQALAELVLIQLQGYMLRGEQPRALRRLLVFDEAWRAASSQRLIQLAREGRAFGVGVIAGSQFADDLNEDLVGNLATRVHLFNSDANRRSAIAKSILGTTTGQKAQELAAYMIRMQPFDAVVTNQQLSPWVPVRTTPYFGRRAAESVDSRSEASSWASTNSAAGPSTKDGRNPG